jgi:hypothetical protein
MKNLRPRPAGRSARPIVFSLLAALLLAGAALWGGTSVEANHPVLVEGNCDSPSVGTTVVLQQGTCGDFDGDGRIGTAEDTDGADRIFGTLRAALGPGTGAAAGTGANFNGKIIIVTSGRFAELLHIGNPLGGSTVGSSSPGNVTIEAAPGVEANIDAVLGGDTAANNNARQSRTGITINYLSQFSNRVVTLRNLVIRNFLVGVDVLNFARVNIDNCRFENNATTNLRVRVNALVVVTSSQIQSAGFRIGSVSASSAPGDGIQILDRAQLRVADTTISHNKGAGINNTAPAANVVLFKVATYFNRFDFSGAVTIAPDPNHSF